MKVLKHEWVEQPLRERVADGDRLVTLAKIRAEREAAEGRRAIAAIAAIAAVKSTADTQD